MPSTAAEQFVRTACIFQAIAALPTFLWMGESTIEQLLWYSYWDSIYDFTKAFFTSIIAAGILCILSVQRWSSMSIKTTFLFEVAKTLLATALWLWLLLDSIFAPQRDYNHHPRYIKITKSAISVLVIFILFLPTLVFAYLRTKTPRTARDQEEVEAEDEPRETSPLLAS
ncbi:hypothetical protein BGZ60DRAFT_125367 [Tricladium varicosporioides]|nr:hypothetical protein BGZ60DRAFT_125367 [Hymenoscyphus varicosporioides]